MLKKLALLVSLLGVTASGAQSGLTEEETRTAGAYPVDHEAKIKAWLQDALKDPDSAILKEARAPRLGAVRTGKKYAPGWIVCYKVNAKNSYGGYTGYHTYLFVFQGGSIAGSLSGGPGYRQEWEEDDRVSVECDLPPTPKPS